jgi:hypothetical protein
MQGKKKGLGALLRGGSREEEEEDGEGEEEDGCEDGGCLCRNRARGGGARARLVGL